MLCLRRSTLAPRGFKLTSTSPSKVPTFTDLFISQESSKIRSSLSIFQSQFKKLLAKPGDKPRKARFKYKKLPIWEQLRNWSGGWEGGRQERIDQYNKWRADLWYSRLPPAVSTQENSFTSSTAAMSTQLESPFSTKLPPELPDMIYT